MLPEQKMPDGTVESTNLLGLCLKMKFQSGVLFLVDQCNVKIADDQKDQVEYLRVLNSTSRSKFISQIHSNGDTSSRNTDNPHADYDIHKLQGALAYSDRRRHEMLPSVAKSSQIERCNNKQLPMRPNDISLTQQKYLTARREAGNGDPMSGKGVNVRA
jgi:hypothetical protein